MQVTKQKMLIDYDTINRYLQVQQEIQLKNNRDLALDTIFFQNWVNAYKNKNTPLARRFIENYDLNFHFTRQKNRGQILIDSVFINKQPAKLFSYNKQEEVFYLKLPDNLSINNLINISISYRIQLPNSKFTGFGIDKENNMLLENFYFHPTDKIRLYPDKNIDNYLERPTDFYIELNNFPKEKNILSNLEQRNNILSGKIKNPVVLITANDYETFRMADKEIWLPKSGKEIDEIEKIRVLMKIYKYMQDNLGDYPYDKMLITEKDLKNNKVYGPDLLPSFVSPFSDKLIWEIELMHIISRKYLDAKVLDKRKYPWIALGVPAFLEYKYVQQYYPGLKLLGNLASYKLIQYYYASQVKMNEKYPWLYLYMARMNKDQALTTQLDSLANFNRNVAMPYKSALGMLMLSEQNDKQKFIDKIKEYYQTDQALNDSLFFRLLVPDKDKKWYSTYINTRNKFDYKLGKITSTNDSIYLSISNKRETSLPLNVYARKNDSIILLQKLPPLQNDTIIGISTSDSYDYVGLNYYNNYPEYQIHNNYVRTGKHLLRKPVQIRPYQDFDNPLKTQIFVNPFFEYNYYDGILIGTQIMNESFLHNDLYYSITPSYATKNNNLTGSFSFYRSHYFTDYKPYAIKYGLGIKYYHYDHDLAYKRFNPYLTFKFRHKYIRKRQGSNLNFQLMYIDKEPAEIKKESDNYTVFDTYYKGFNVNVIKDFFYKADLQLSSKFGKVSGMLRYRYLTNKNRQWDFRIYAGAFLYNHTTTDYFSFALDRPTDYLFQHNYYGRSETTGIFHQQFIWAEGGFKTFFDDQYANQYIISNNVNIGVWKWFNLYADWAWKKNKGQATGFYYDSGLRINLVQDYFEVFFPVYSKLGWEIKENDYLQRIRLVFTMDINGLFKMVRRGWY